MIRGMLGGIAHPHGPGGSDDSRSKGSGVTKLHHGRDNDDANGQGSGDTGATDSGKKHARDHSDNGQAPPHVANVAISSFDEIT